MTVDRTPTRQALPESQEAPTLLVNLLYSGSGRKKKIWPQLPPLSCRGPWKPIPPRRSFSYKAFRDLLQEGAGNGKDLCCAWPVLQIFSSSSFFILETFAGLLQTFYWRLMLTQDIPKRA